MKNQKIDNLYKSILLLENIMEARNFFRDLLTEAEMTEFANRWQAAQMLEQKVSYEEIIKETGLSSRTVARISKWLNSGMGGYKQIIEKNNHHKSSD